MRKVDIVAAIGLLAFVAAMVFIVIPAEHSGGAWFGLSPYFYPMVMLIGIALSSVGLLVQAITRPAAYEDQPKTPLTLAELGFFLLGSLIVFAGVVALHLWGTWVGGAVLIAGLMVFMGEFNPLKIALVAVPTLAFTWAIVTWALQIQLP